MKRKIKKIGLGIIMWFISYTAITVIFDDSNAAFKTSITVFFGYFIILTLHSYISNLLYYFKYKQFPKYAIVATTLIEMLVIKKVKTLISQ